MADKMVEDLKEKKKKELAFKKLQRICRANDKRSQEASARIERKKEKERRTAKDKEQRHKKIDKHPGIDWDAIGKKKTRYSNPTDQQAG